jgi:hypothetical protein
MILDLWVLIQPLLSSGVNRRKKKIVSKGWSVAVAQLVEELTHNLGSNPAIAGTRWK